MRVSSSPNAAVDLVSELASIRSSKSGSREVASERELGSNHGYLRRRATFDQRLCQLPGIAMKLSKVAVEKIGILF